MLNQIVLQGRLVKDPELRHTPGGVPVAGFTLAVDRDFKDRQTGERETDFIDVVAWRQAGEFAARHFTRGRMAVVEGRLQLRVWQDRDGNRRRSPEVVAERLYFGDSPRPEAMERRDAHPSAAGAGGASLTVSPALEELDDDGELPF